MNGYGCGITLYGEPFDFRIALGYVLSGQNVYTPDPVSAYSLATVASLITSNALPYYDDHGNGDALHYHLDGHRLAQNRMNPVINVHIFYGLHGVYEGWEVIAVKYFTKDWYAIARNMDGFMRHDGNEYQWLEEKEAALQPAREQYAKHINELKEKLPDSFDFVRLNMHDSWIVTETYDGKDLVFDIQSQWGFSNVKRLLFRNAKIIENDGRVRDTCWISDELYLTDDNQYEIHILVQGDTGLVSRVIIADDVLVEASDDTIIP